ncbi:MAG: HlyC/CorC family transporter [Flavobacteriaceae bacterium]|nr:HlyC/CorC family transporter [Flavobacteriaceae bacterium]
MLLDIFVILFFVLLNGFFVASEFAIVKVRYSQIHLKAEQGNKIAKRAEHIINHLDTYLSATQLGITLASLALGWLGEPVVAEMIKSFIDYWRIQISEKSLHTLSVVIGFTLITTLHIVFGELAPKSIAIRKAEATTLAISYPLHVFFVVLKPFIWLMNHFSNFILNIIGIKPVGEHETHSVDELRLLVDQSKEGGIIQAENYEIIKNAFDFTDHSARQIMVPRHEIFALDIDLPTKDLVEKVLENGYSRIPIYEDSMDNLIGIAYAKDIFKEYFKKPNFKIKNILDPVYYVYENKLISEILTDFQKQHIHMAVVMDEFGSAQGIITLEDILEELVGEIQDEDDEEKPIVERNENGSIMVQTMHSLVDINELLPHPFELNENYTTLAGLLLYHFKRIPKVNDKIVLEGYEISITKLQRRTIHTVILKDANLSEIEEEA